MKRSELAEAFKAAWHEADERGEAGSRTLAGLEAVLDALGVTPDPEDGCAFEVRRPTFIDPPEYCEEESVPGSEFCAGHDPDALDDALEAVAEARKEARLYGSGY